MAYDMGPRTRKAMAVTITGFVLVTAMVLDWLTLWIGYRLLAPVAPEAWTVVTSAPGAWALRFALAKGPLLAVWAVWSSRSMYAELWHSGQPPDESAPTGGVLARVRNAAVDAVLTVIAAVVVFGHVAGVPYGRDLWLLVAATIAVLLVPLAIPPLIKALWRLLRPSRGRGGPPADRGPDQLAAEPETASPAAPEPAAPEPAAPEPA